MKGYRSKMPLLDLRPAPLAMVDTTYDCGCKAAGDLVAKSCPMHGGPSVVPVDPSVLPTDVPRLKGAGQRVLARLKEGPATGMELVAVGGTRYGAILFDLRKAGVVWKCEHKSRSDWIYTLILCPVELE